MEYNDFYKNVRAISQIDPDVNEDQQNQIANTLKDMKKKYLSTDDKMEKGRLNEKISGLANAVMQNETFIYETSDALADTKTFSKHSYDTLNPDVKSVLPDILNKKTYPVTKGGKTGYEVNGNFMTLGQIQDEVKKRTPSGVFDGEYYDESPTQLTTLSLSKTVKRVITLNSGYIADGENKLMISLFKSPLIQYIAFGDYETVTTVTLNTTSIVKQTSHKNGRSINYTFEIELENNEPVVAR